MKDTTISLTEVSKMPHKYMRAVYGNTCAVCGNRNNSLHHIEDIEIKAPKERSFQ